MSAAKVRTKFVPMVGSTDTFVVEDHRGSTVVSPGRVAKFGPLWSALPCWSPRGRVAAWTPYRTTRREAVADLRLELERGLDRDLTPVSYTP